VLEFNNIILIYIYNRNIMIGGSTESELVGGTVKMGPASFFNYVFNFDSDNKAILLNMFQYIIIALIPIVLILKFV